MNKLDYEKVFNTLVNETRNYVVSNNLKCMVLGISGGIDSTVVAAICYEVSKQTDVAFIGRSLPIKNKNDEFDVSKLAGETFCEDFKVVNLHASYRAFLYNRLCENSYIGATSIEVLENANGQTPIANGNIQARLRMIYLYNLAAILKGLVMSTDNQTEYQLGFWTLHGDVGDFNPLQDLWKTEVYELAEWLLNDYDHWRNPFRNDSGGASWNEQAYSAMKASMALTPTDGLGISNSDLDQIGAKSYNEVDDILQTLLMFNSKESDFVAFDILYRDCIKKYGKDVVDKVWKRHKASEFKRKKSPIYIERSKYE